jgi:4-hydroxy-4-methyl-2-oxoglutarate aldolase
MSRTLEQIAGNRDRVDLFAGAFDRRFQMVLVHIAHGGDVAPYPPAGSAACYPDSAPAHAPGRQTKASSSRSSLVLKWGGVAFEEEERRAAESSTARRVSVSVSEELHMPMTYNPRYPHSNPVWAAAFLGIAALAGLCLRAADAPPPPRSGTNYLATPVYSAAEDAEVLQAFAGLRVADVSDGMDAVGLPNTGLVSADLQPLWKDTDHYSHRIIGIAVTARYVPSQESPVGPANVADYDRWAGRWYQTRSPEPFVPLLRVGSVLVIDDADEADVGSIGSNNILSWKAKGCVGVITDATARDTDEIIAQRVPLYFRKPGRGIRPGRNEIESVNRPIVLGGALVIPGDVMVADGDGIIVVPRARALAVAAYARGILEGDKAGRRQLYRQLGLPEDPSVR